jgi:hypothetical protein
MNSIEATGKRQKRRSVLPLLIVVIAGGLFLWGQSRDDALTRSVADTVQNAALAVCGSTAMPPQLRWTVPDFKLMFIKMVKPACGGGDPALTLSAHAIPGDQEAQDGQATHIVTIRGGAVALLRLRVHAQSEDHITVLGWSQP